MLPEFLTYLEAERRYSPLTVRNYRHDVEQFLAWLGVDEARFEPRRITHGGHPRMDSLPHRNRARVSAASMNREVSSLRALFRWLLRTGAVDRDIVARRIPSLRTSRRLPAFVPESRMAYVIADINGRAGSEDFVTVRDALTVAMFYGCGIRLGELIALEPQRFGRLPAGAHPLEGDKERIVPLVDLLAAYFGPLPPTDPAAKHLQFEEKSNGIQHGKERAFCGASCVALVE